LATSGHATDRYDALRRLSLKGLPPVRVLAECAPDLVQEGLDCEALRGSAETQLGDAKIAVLGETADAQTKSAFLTLSAASAKLVGNHTFQTYGVNLRVDLIQDVTVPRMPNQILPATTWSASRTLVLGPRRIKDLSQDVDELVSLFVTDYKAAQP
jgi:hypothetical protein